MSDSGLFLSVFSLVSAENEILVLTRMLLSQELPQWDIFSSIWLSVRV